jgi:predicted GIY-YIG superfamily endonuclease
MTELRNRKHYLYMLKDPITLEIKWIGITNNKRNRFRNHMNGNSPGNEQYKLWIETLKISDLKPIVITIKEFNNKENAEIFESKLISGINTVLNINSKNG